MSHLSPEALWAFAERTDAALEVPEHLAHCAACSQALADIQGAQQLLAVLPSAPDLPKALAARVGEKLATQLDASLVRSPLRNWLSQLLTPRLMLGFAALLLAGLATIALWPTPEQPAQAPALAALTAPTTPAPEPLAPPKPTATVAAADRASALHQPVHKAQRLEQGASLTTEAKGSLWLTLPDGSRAGLTSSSQLTLATLEAKRLELSLSHGSLALEVPHRTDRVLTVTAGPVTVKDLGTRFLVSKNDARVLIAVQEGEVEVVTPTSTQVVKAGHAVSWHDGRLDVLNWDSGEKARAPASAKPPASKLRDDDDEPALAAPGPAENEPEGEPEADEDEAVVQAAPPASSADEWVLPQQVKSAPPPRPAPPLVVRTKRRGLLNLTVLEEKLEALTRAFAGVPLRASLVKSIARAVDHADCAQALLMADAWLRDPVTSLVDEPAWRRAVLTQKLRCLTAQGRTQEASEIRRLLDGP